MRTLSQNCEQTLQKLVNFTLPGLRFHTLQTRVFFSLALSDPCTLSSSPVPRPFLARSSPGPRPALARPSPGPLPALAHPRFKQSCGQNGQKRNLLPKIANKQNYEQTGVSAVFRKILVSVKLRVRNSGAGNGCANFMDTWKNAFFLQEKPCFP